MEENHDAAERWRSKYVKSLDDRDLLESRMEERIDQLRKTLLVVMLVCEGVDAELDDRLKALSSELRGETGKLKVGPLVAKVQDRADKILARKDIGQLRQAFAVLLRQLKSQEVDGDIKKLLTRQEKSLKDSLRGFVDLEPQLNQLAEHQEQVLDALALQPPSEAREQSESPFWQRLLGRNGKGEERQTSQSVDESGEDGEYSLAQQMTPEDNLVSATVQSPEHDTSSLIAESETLDFTALSRHVGGTLLDLLSQLTVPERAENEALVLKKNIDAGLSWYELVPNLETLNRVILATVGQSRDEFENYLKVMHGRLAEFQSRAGLLQEGMDRARDGNVNLQDNLRAGIDSLHRSVNEAVDLESLKQDVGQQLDSILHTIEDHRQESAQEETSAKMQELVGRLQQMERQTQDLKTNLSRERAKATRDGLTGLPNRLAYETRVENEFARWKRYQESLVIAVADIDLFKRVNDRFGHLAGDKLLRIFARQLQKNLREVDFIARFGGEEFVILMPNTTLNEGYQVADKVRSVIQQTPLHYKEEELEITASFGVTVFGEGDTVEAAFARADKALYQAKEQGRNKVCKAE